MSKITVFDAACHILKKCGPMSAMKLQKLVYYSQAWALVWDDEPLFNEEIAAWSSGPVVRELYDEHRGLYQIEQENFSNKAKNKLTDNQKDTINTVLKAYSSKSAQWLSDQTHIEQPWIAARAGLPDNVRGNQVITLESMAEYYGSL
ncbi:MAG: DUF4065 domain-containing protein [Gammaproteobacteria bacterium]|nr:DUF4065 domain-containing protein [Gammaproteobacteria bacterium]